MTLESPLCISARLLPAVEISDAHSKAWLSWDASSGLAYLDFPGASGLAEYVITDFSPGRGSGNDPRKCLAELLSFLGACAESRKYASLNDEDPMSGKNSYLFPAEVGEWAEGMSDEIACLEWDLEESDRN